MSIAQKHAYRFGYLKSEEWQNVRAAVLARDDARCWFCGIRDISNDVHHVFYPKSIWNTKSQHCVTLCRSCHDKVHILLKVDGGGRWINNILKRLRCPHLPLHGVITDLRKRVLSVRQSLYISLKSKLSSIKLKAYRLEKLSDRKSWKQFPTGICTICKAKTLTTPRKMFRYCGDWHLCSTCFETVNSSLSPDSKTRDVVKCIDGLRKMCKSINMATTPPTVQVGSPDTPLMVSLGKR